MSPMLTGGYNRAYEIRNTYTMYDIHRPGLISNPTIAMTRKVATIRGILETPNSFHCKCNSANNQRSHSAPQAPIRRLDEVREPSVTGNAASLTQVWVGGEIAHLSVAFHQNGNGKIYAYAWYMYTCVTCTDDMFTPCMQTSMNCQVRPKACKIHV